MTEKSCLIIGGGRGMGASTAREMHARDYKLALMSPSESCETLATELGGVALRGKAENAEDTKAIFDLAMERYGRIDACLIHVGGPPKGDLLEIPEEDWDRANEMILKPVIRMAKLLTPVMEAQGGGSIVNITTFSAFEPSLTFPTSSVYRVGVSSFTKLYSDRYGPANIRMNCLLPGFTDSLDLPQKFADMSALGRLARAEEQAKAAAFLLTDDSSYITGQSLRVDGGVTKHM
ncbi:3-oxoacyl-[acyl-carrier-protein] reductase FabG [Thalassovita autumnalis]|uniref:3-oxoacyl-[acyl-carrier-protein] reductase FabG n=1 Tax=Thalassovita autumnalis TaxID=2072972 RepID=A0A0P1G9M7_9RHOB|nr:SDR family oxidoreductase [Thalassovita autumnalis]CUH70220.1 3-oxoacyl-[acyl-carrier-protein] reductase FabG [Thalassovita autumnalis]CUH71850.1 3-oxoacyl-[acyl-carrier-protein] reductase FabG [Thalassovita autumnalis]